MACLVSPMEIDWSAISRREVMEPPSECVVQESTRHDKTTEAEITLSGLNSERKLSLFLFLIFNFFLFSDMIQNRIYELIGFVCSIFPGNINCFIYDDCRVDFRLEQKRKAADA